MTPQEFAATIRAKYPQYRKIPDDKLVSSYLDKFPQYRELVKEEPKTPLLMRQPNEGVEQHEPDTFWGGFGKSVLDQVMAGGKDNPIRRAANPQTVSDMAPLLLPGASGAGNFLKGYKSAGEEAISAASGQKGILNKFKSATGAAWHDLSTDAESKAARAFSRKPLATQMESGKLPTVEAPVTTRGQAPPPRGEAPPEVPFHERPTYQQMEDLPATEGGANRSAPGHLQKDTTAVRESTPPDILAKAQASAPTLAGKAPTLEEELQKALLEAGKPSDPRITSMAPEQGITPGAPIKQSGKFGKADALGKPGGYSSGNPGTTPEQSGLKSVEAQGVHTDALAEQEHKRLLDKFGGRGEDVAAPGAEAPSAMPEPSSAPAPEAMPQTDVEKPHVGWKEALDNLQTRVGARDAARAVGGKQAGYTPEDIRGITGKRGQLPQEAQDRILEDMLRKAMERDQP